MAATDLRPLRIGEILDISIKLYLKHAWTLLKIVLVVVAPIEILTALIQSSLPGSDLTGGGFSQGGNLGGPTPTVLTRDDLPAFFAGNVAIVVLTVLMVLLATAACYKAVGDAYLGEMPEWTSSLKFAVKRIGPLLWVGFLATALTIVGFVFCLLPGFWLLISFSLAAPVVLTENVRGTKALRRSFGLVRQRWWPTFATLFVGYLLTSIVTFGVSALLAVFLLSGSGNDFVRLLVLALGGIVSRTLTTPFLAALVMIIYFDQRVRKEGFDIEVLAERIGITAHSDETQGFVPRTVTPPSEAPPYWPPPPGWPPPSAGQPPEDPQG